MTSALGKPRPEGSESELRDWIVGELRCPGLRVDAERTMIFGRCDIAVSDSEGLKAIIEVKIADPLKGIGQLFLYAVGYKEKYPDLTLILAIPRSLDDGKLEWACKEADVYLWVISDKERFAA